VSSLYKLFGIDSKSRGGVITVLSLTGMVINFAIALMKITVGSMVGSMAIISEGINNAADAGSSFLTLVGTKLASMKPTKNHPFGFGRIEYLTSLIIGTIILLAGSELFLNSVKLILEPENVSVSYVTMGLIAGSAVIKLFVSYMQITEGNRIGSDSLTAVGREGRQDALGSIITIASGFAYLLLGLNLDAYASLLISALVLKLSYDILSDTVGKLLGRVGEKELAEALYREIRQEPIIVNAADMMLHNYGPDAYSGSVNIEIDHKQNLGEVYKEIHALQLRLMAMYHITMVFGIYAVDNDNPMTKVLRLKLTEFVRGYDHLLSYHALYVDEINKDIYIDLMVDYELKEWERLEKEFVAFMGEHYPEYNIKLVIETQYV